MHSMHLDRVFPLTAWGNVKSSQGFALHHKLSERDITDCYQRRCSVPRLDRGRVYIMPLDQGRPLALDHLSTFSQTYRFEELAVGRKWWLCIVRWKTCEQIIGSVLG